MSSEAYRLRPHVKADPDGPVDRTRVASVALHVSTVLYVMTGALLVMVPFTWDWQLESDALLRASVTWVLAGLCLGLAVFSMSVARGLRRRRRWAWIASVVLFVLYLPSVFLPIGAVGLYAVLGEGTRAKFLGLRGERSKGRY